MNIDEYTGLQIAPCPFCGSSASVVCDTDKNGDDYNLVECNGCTAFGPASNCHLNYTGIIDSQKERVSAITKWNKRHISCLEEIIRQAHRIGVEDQKFSRPLHTENLRRERTKRIANDIQWQLDNLKITDK